MKKGFTLIELLAVIVILAIIATIATPIVLNIIKDAKKSSSKRSMENYIHSIELSVANKEFDGSKINDGVYPIEDLDLEINGKVPDTGYVLIKNEKIMAYYLEQDKQVLTYDGENNEVPDDGTWEYIVLDTGKIQLTKYNGNANVLVVPSKVGDKEVYSVGAGIEVKNILGKYYYDVATGTMTPMESSFDAVIFSEGIEKVNTSAFSGLSNLKQVFFSSAISYLGDKCFQSDGIESILIPKGISYMGKNVFSLNYNLKRVYYDAINCESGWENRTTESHFPLFYNSPLNEVKIGKNAKNLPNYLFSANLDVNTFKEIILPKTIKSIGKNVFQLNNNLKTIYYNIPDVDVKWISEDGATTYPIFYLCGVENIYISNDVKNIPRSLFNRAGIDNLTEITIPNSVENIGTSAFSSNSKLETLNISYGIKKIDNKAFKNTMLSIINYKGTIEEFSKIFIGEENEIFTNANVNYVK